MVLLYLLVVTALMFDFTNGANDSANIVATAVSSGAISQRKALALAAAAEFIAPFLFGVAVATTLGSGLVELEAISLPVVLAATVAAISWNLITRALGIPSSSSHALIGGLLGAAILTRGFEVVQTSGLIKILAGLFVSPLLGLVFGYLLTNLVLFLARYASPRINHTFKRLQIVTLISLALSYGSNDSQKTMGLIALGLVAAGVQESFHVPLWVIASSAAAISLGTLFGGWRLIHTLGGKIYRIRPVNAFSSQFASAAVILGAAALGSPVSTTHVISSAIMGSGAAERVNKVRWGLAQDMLFTWVATIPLTAVFSALVYAGINAVIEARIFIVAMLGF